MYAARIQHYFKHLQLYNHNSMRCYMCDSLDIGPVLEFDTLILAQRSGQIPGNIRDISAKSQEAQGVHGAHMRCADNAYKHTPDATGRQQCTSHLFTICVFLF